MAIWFILNGTRKSKLEIPVYMLNSGQMLRKIQQRPKLAAMVRERNSLRDLVSQLYLTILFRYPTDDEWALVAGRSKSGSARGQAANVELAWTLLNSTESLYRHLGGISI